MVATFRAPSTGPSLKSQRNDARGQAAAVWDAWALGASHHSAGSRVTFLAQFGRFAYRISDKIAVIRRVMEAVRVDFGAFRELALQFIEHLRELRRSAATLRQRWRTLAALLAVIARQTRAPAKDLGPLPEPAPREKIDRGDALALARELASGPTVNRHRDAAIIGLLGDAGLHESVVLALRVRDIRSIACAPEIAAALEECTRGELPQSYAIRGPQGRALSRAALYDVVRHAGTTIAALGRAASS